MHSPVGKARKRIASAACVLGMVIVCLGIVGYQNQLKADPPLPVVTRGVIDHIEQIPETKRTMYDANKSAEDMEKPEDYKLGTKNNPFVILEIVPYEEYGSFGYQIGGCEPVDMNEARHEGLITTLQKINGSIAEQQSPAYFFSDEPEVTSNAELSKKLELCEWLTQDHDGYYELVEDGKGVFKQNKDGTIVKAQGGNIVWHTISTSEKKYDYANVKFQASDVKKDVMTKLGDRIYTQRKSSSSDPVYRTYSLYYYKNSENFLKQSLGLSDEEAKNYSVVIKTITPKDLNRNIKWVEYADLYVVTTELTMNLKWDEYTALWNKYNWYGKTATSTTNKSSFENVGNEKDKDISWDVALAMYNKINADINYAPIVMTTSTYMGTLTQKKEIRTQIFDWNLNFSGHYDEATRTAYNNNMYKLAIMLFSMKPDLFKKLYLDEENPLIVDGKYIKPTAYMNKKNEIIEDKEIAQSYWTEFTFLLTDANGEAPNSWWQYWVNEPDKWKDYEMAGEITSDANQFYVNNRVYVSQTNGGLTNLFGDKYSTISSGNANSKFTDFRDYLEENKPNGHGPGQATSADAVHYILGKQNKKDNKIKGDLNILDVEPCYDSTKGYSLTKNYIYLMMPNFDGNINITHMTTAEFIGNNEDLNSTYNMIFMGLDDGAYNKEKQTLKDGANKDVGGVFTKWNDSAMNGKIYFHTGDVATGRCDPNNKNSVKFLWLDHPSDTQDKDKPDLRFPGNDITKIKKTELSNFLAAGYPIVAVPYLYNTNKLRIDQHSNICSFITEEKNNKSTLYRTDDASSIENAVKRTQTDIEWQKLPNIYNGSTATETDATIEDANYLEQNNNGRSLLPFEFKVKDDSDQLYKYCIYVDQNKDGKFDEDELLYEGKQFKASDGVQKKTLQISQLFVGFIQWKIEVYRKDNNQIRFTQTGCSASKNRTGNQIEIRVLQIKPNNCNLDLKTNSMFKKYYANLSDYKITVETMSRESYQKYFTSSEKFVFDYSKDISTEDGDAKNPSSFSDGQKNLYDSYDMIILGFHDTYGGEDISNEYGAVDFLKYFAAKGKSVLFTHDITSMNNIKEGNDNPFGYSANMLLRDLMGMNRYQAIHKDLSDAERTKLKQYQAKNKYDTVTGLNGQELDEKQGFTYYTIKRLGTGNKMPYSALVKNGFNTQNDLTMKATKTNDGQITQYPYKIGEWTTDSATGQNVFDDSKLSIAVTHGQWYQLDMEDPEVTVWYCLTNDDSDAYKDMIKNRDYDNPGDSTTYSVSPNDAANNYYIYSKGNIFYSGVGHSEVKGDMEAKLFINTIIGAYRTPYEPPVVEVLNSEAELTDRKNMMYTMKYNQEYDMDGSLEVLSDQPVNTTNEGEGSDQDPNMVKIRFSPIELNMLSTHLSMSLYYYDEESQEKTYITKIYHELDDGTVEELTTDSAKDWFYADEQDSQGKYTSDHIKSMDEYYFYYPKAYLTENWTDSSGVKHSKPRRTIKFEVKSNKVKESGFTTLNMQTQSLFLLD